MFVNNLFASTGATVLRLPVRELDYVQKTRLELTRAWQRRWKALEMGEGA